MMSFSCAPSRSSSSSESSRRARCATWLSCSRSIAISVSDSPDEKRPLSGPLQHWGPTGSLDGLDVRGLRALRALHNLERHFLALGQRLVAVHADRREVDEDVVAALALDEAVALLVREPFHGALCQLWCLLLLMENDGPEYSSGNARYKAPLRPCSARGVLQDHRDRHRADAPGHRRHVAGDLHRARVDVAEEAVVGAVHADVDHRRAGLDHVGTDEVKLPDGSDEDVGVERVALEV